MSWQWYGTLAKTFAQSQQGPLAAGAVRRLESEGQPFQLAGPSLNGGPAVPFGSHQFPYKPGTLKPSGAQSTIDQAVVTYYNKWKAAPNGVCAPVGP